MGEKEPGSATPEQEAKDAARAGDAIRALFKMEGFNVLQAALQAARTHWTNIAMQPAQSEAAAWRSEYAKGAVFGLTLAFDLPSVIIGAGQIAEADTANNSEGAE